MIAEQLSFSERHGLVRPPEIAYRGELPARLRAPIVRLLKANTSAAFLWERIDRLLKSVWYR